MDKTEPVGQAEFLDKRAKPGGIAEPAPAPTTPSVAPDAPVLPPEVPLAAAEGVAAVGVSLPLSEIAALDARAQKQGIQRDALLSTIIKEWLDHNP